MFGHEVSELGFASALTPTSVESLRKMRPWIRLSVYYGYLVGLLVVFAAGATLVTGLTKAENWIVAGVYLLYLVFVLAMVLPLDRSGSALRDLQVSSGSRPLEDFLVHQSVFWRRIGLLTLFGLAILLLLVVAGVAVGVAEVFDRL